MAWADGPGTWDHRGCEGQRAVEKRFICGFHGAGALIGAAPAADCPTEVWVLGGEHTGWDFSGAR